MHSQLMNLTNIMLSERSLIQKSAFPLYEFQNQAKGTYGIRSQDSYYLSTWGEGGFGNILFGNPFHTLPHCPSQSHLGIHLRGWPTYSFPSSGWTPKQAATGPNCGPHLAAKVPAQIFIAIPYGCMASPGRDQPELRCRRQSLQLHILSYNCHVSVLLITCSRLLPIFQKFMINSSLLTSTNSFPPPINSSFQSQIHDWNNHNC